MAERHSHARVLIYSHDSFGLGHLRRCRAIADALVTRNARMSVLILSGSPIIGSFDFPNRVDFVRVPGVIKLRNGEYTSLKLPMAIDEALAIRAEIIEHTAATFDPDLFLVDKEPLGLRGEVRGTLELLKSRGTPLVLGLRDVMDEPSLLVPEWERKNVIPALDDLYDAIWVYGLPEICNPLEGLDLPPAVRGKIAYTGYLRRAAKSGVRPIPLPVEHPYILVTPGGGGDGEALVDWVLSAYESDRQLPLPALVVLGPFMPLERQAEFAARAAELGDVDVLTFDAHLEMLMLQAAAVVAMGGYNTFCEILSFDKPSILVPRTAPRLEQRIRASRAQALGLVRMLEQDGGRPPEAMAEALRALPHQPKPSDQVITGLLDGLDTLDSLVTAAIAERPRHQYRSGGHKRDGHRRGKRRRGGTPERLTMPPGVSAGSPARVPDLTDAGNRTIAVRR